MKHSNVYLFSTNRPFDYIFIRRRLNLYLAMLVVSIPSLIGTLLFSQNWYVNHLCEDLPDNPWRAAEMLLPSDVDLPALLIAMLSFQAAIALVLAIDSGKGRLNGSLESLSCLSLYITLFYGLFAGVALPAFWREWKFFGFVLVFFFCLASCELAFVSDMKKEMKERIEDREKWLEELKKQKEVYCEVIGFLEMSGGKNVKDGFTQAGWWCLGLVVGTAETLHITFLMVLIFCDSIQNCIKSLRGTEMTKYIIYTVLLILTIIVLITLISVVSSYFISLFAIEWDASRALDDRRFKEDKKCSRQNRWGFIPNITITLMANGSFCVFAFVFASSLNGFASPGVFICSGIIHEIFFLLLFLRFPYRHKRVCLFERALLPARYYRLSDEAEKIGQEILDVDQEIGLLKDSYTRDSSFTIDF